MIFPSNSINKTRAQSQKKSPSPSPSPFSISFLNLSTAVHGSSPFRRRCGGHHLPLLPPHLRLRPRRGGAPPFLHCPVPGKSRPPAPGEAQPPPLLLPRHPRRPEPHGGAGGGAAAVERLADSVRRGGDDGRSADGAAGNRVEIARKSSGNVRLRLANRIWVSDGYEFRVREREVQWELSEHFGSEYGDVRREGDAGSRRRRVVPIRTWVRSGEDSHGGFRHRRRRRGV